MLARFLVASLGVAAIAIAHPASAYTFQTIFSFCSQPGKCQLGKDPAGGVIEDGDGNLYGTDYVSANDGDGTVFALSPTGKRGAWQYTNLHTFCKNHRGCTKEGQGPMGSVVRDTSGNLYGLTYYGGTQVGGTLYEISPNDDFTKYSYRTLYNFCDGDTCNGSAGLNSSIAYEASGSGGAYDGVAPLYTSGYTGGSDGHEDCGAIFQLVPSAGKRGWRRNVIHSFGDETGNDGCAPRGRLIFDAQGDIFGATTSGNGTSQGVGTVYELKPNAKRTKWTETILYVFCAGHSGSGTCPDGAQPNGVTLDNNGRLVGTTFAGGTGAGDPNCNLYEGGPNCGVVFRLGRSGGAWHYSVLYDFCALPECADGKASYSILAVDGSNNLLGTLTNGQNHGGAIFELSTTGTENILEDFCPDGVCGNDGDNPNDPLIIDASGKILGTTGEGGTGNGGTVFALTP
jgi:hypothetical protein